MKAIVGARGSGRTRQLIDMSAESGSYLVCLNREEAHRVFRWAVNLGIRIPYPITFDEFLGGRFCARGIRGFLIDNADTLLQQLAGRVLVEGFSVSNNSR